jgi:glycosyltransferase involved in cell wall biosynthesis
VIKDLKSFSLEYEVKDMMFAPKVKWMLPFVMLQQFIKLLLTRNYNTIVCQFGGYHSFGPALFKRLFRKKLIIIVGGYDAVALPQIRYGGFQNKWMKKALIYSYTNADLILPVHHSLMFSTQQYAPESPTHQGIRHFIPQLKTPHIEIPNGYNAEQWPMHAVGTREKICITVAGGLTENRRYTLKGIDMVMSAAEKLPEFKFIIIGGEVSHTLKNVEFVNEVKNEALSSYFNQAMIYLQLSLSEGFPNALCEAMLSGCIPVVSNIAAMPTIVGNEGYVIEKKDIDLIVSTIKQIPSIHSVEKMSRVRNRISNEYTEERRTAELLKAIAIV